MGNTINADTRIIYDRLHTPVTVMELDEIRNIVIVYHQTISPEWEDPAETICDPSKYQKTTVITPNQSPKQHLSVFKVNCNGKSALIRAYPLHHCVAPYQWIVVVSFKEQAFLRFLFHS